MKLILIDASGFIHRAYHALPPLVRSDGLPVGAVHGYCEMLHRVIRESGRATHIASVFDHGGSKYRRELYAEYKANRPPQADALKQQFPYCRAATDAYGVQVLSQHGYEADDVIATYTARAVAEGMDVEIVSIDKDLMQLVGPHVTQFDPVKRKVYSEADVETKWGVPPRLIVDFLALTGDAIDNVPGVPGVGPKTAADLLRKFGSLDAVVENATLISKPSVRTSISSNQDKAFLSRHLVRLIDDVPLCATLDQLRRLDGYQDTLREFLAEMEFEMLLGEMEVAHV